MTKVINQDNIIKFHAWWADSHACKSPNSELQRMFYSIEVQRDISD